MLENNFKTINLNNILKKKFLDIFNKFKSNKLLSGIIYSYKMLNENDFNLLTIFYDCSLKMNNSLKNKENTECLILSNVLSFISLKICYNFKHMLNHKFINKNISINTLYGETISQLTSFCLLIEAKNLILNNNNWSNNFKMKLINNLINHKNENELKIFKVKNLNIKNNDILDDFYNKLFKMLLINLTSLHICNEKEYNVNFLKKIINIIIDQYKTKILLNNNKIDKNLYNNILIKNKLIINNILKNHKNENNYNYSNLIDMFK